MPRIKANSRGKFVQMYYPPGAWQAWQKIVALAAKRYRPPVPFSGPVKFSAEYYFPRPKYMDTDKYPSDPYYMIVKPDRDNLDKLTLDVFTKLGFWEDDCQVCSGHISKSYVGRAGYAESSPGVYIYISHQPRIEPIKLKGGGRKKETHITA